MTQKPDLKELRKIAEAATPGPWERDGVGVLGAREDWDGGKGPARIMKAMMPWRTERMEANAEHVATFDPPTVLALLSRVEKAERSCRLLGTIIERDGKNLVELTNSQDIIPEDGDGDWEVVWERAQEMKVRLEQAEQAVARVRAMADGMGEGKAFGILTRGREDEYPISYFIEMLEGALDGEPNE